MNQKYTIWMHFISMNNSENAYELVILLAVHCSVTSDSPYAFVCFHITLFFVVFFSFLSSTPALSLVCYS